MTLTKLVYGHNFNIPVLEEDGTERLLTQCISDINKLIQLYPQASNNVDSYDTFSDLIEAIQEALVQVNKSVTLK